MYVGYMRVRVCMYSTCTYVYACIVHVCTCTCMYSVCRVHACIHVFTNPIVFFLHFLHLWLLLTHFIRVCICLECKLHSVLYCILCMCIIIDVHVHEQSIHFWFPFTLVCISHVYGACNICWPICMCVDESVCNYIHTCTCTSYWLCLRAAIS